MCHIRNDYLIILMFSVSKKQNTLHAIERTFSLYHMTNHLPIYVNYYTSNVNLIEYNSYSKYLSYFYLSETNFKIKCSL